MHMSYLRLYLEGSGNHGVILRRSNFGVRMRQIMARDNSNCNLEGRGRTREEEIDI